MKFPICEPKRQKAPVCSIPIVAPSPFKEKNSETKSNITLPYTMSMSKIVTDILERQLLAREVFEKNGITYYPYIVIS